MKPHYEISTNNTMLKSSLNVIIINSISQRKTYNVLDLLEYRCYLKASVVPTGTTVFRFLKALGCSVLSTMTVPLEARGTQNRAALN